MLHRLPHQCGEEYDTEATLVTKSVGNEFISGRIIITISTHRIKIESDHEDISEKYENTYSGGNNYCVVCKIKEQSPIVVRIICYIF